MISRLLIIFNRIKTIRLLSFEKSVWTGKSSMYLVLIHKYCVYMQNNIKNKIEICLVYLTYIWIFFFFYNFLNRYVFLLLFNFQLLFPTHTYTHTIYVHKNEFICTMYRFYALCIWSKSNINKDVTQLSYQYQVNEFKNKLIIIYISK